MIKVANLDDIVVALCDYDMTTDYFYDRKNDDVLHIFYNGDKDDILEEIETDKTGRFVPIAYEEGNIGWNAMRAFALSVEDETKRDRLLDAISGKGAFRLFGILTDDYGLTRDWRSFEDGFYNECAREWCRDNDVMYIEKN